MEPVGLRGVGALLDDLLVDEPGEAHGQDLPRRSEVGVEGVEPRDADEQVTQDQRRPRLAPSTAVSAVPSDEEFLAYNQGVVAEFRANRGVVSQPDSCRR